MKGIGLVLTLAFLAMAMLAVPATLTSTGMAVAGIDGRGAPHAGCNPEDGLLARGCTPDDSGRIVVASIVGSGGP